MWGWVNSRDGSVHVLIPDQMWATARQQALTTCIAHVEEGIGSLELSSFLFRRHITVFRT